MAYRARSFNLSWKCYCDPEAYVGFNLAITLRGALTPANGAIVTKTINPAWRSDGSYTHAFTDVLMDDEKAYDMWVQLVSYGRDSMWRSVAGVEAGDEGGATLGGAVSIKDIQNAINSGDIVVNGDIITNIDGNITNLSNIYGGSLVANTITTLQLNASSITSDNAFIKTLVVDGIATINEAWIGGVHIKDNTVTADKVIVNGELTAKLATVEEAWIGGVHIKDNTVTADKVVVNGELTAKLATVEEAWIGGVHIKDNSITAKNITADSIESKHIKTGSLDASTINTQDLAVNGLAKIKEAWIGSVHIVDDSITAGKIGADAVTAKTISAGSINAGHISAGSISTEHLRADSITSDHIKAKTIQSTNIAADAIEAINIRVSGELTSKLATIEEAWIGGVHIKDNTIKANNIDAFDLAVNALAQINVAYITEANIEYGSIKNAHIGVGEIDFFHLKEGIIGSAQIADFIESENYSPGLSGWHIAKDGSAEFTSGITVANWLLDKDRIKSRQSGDRIELNSLLNRISILGSLGDTRVAMGYLDGLPKPDLSGNYGASDYGFFVGDGNTLRMIGDGEFSSGDWSVRHDGAFLVKNSLQDTIVKMGTESGETGFFCYDEFGNIISALTNARFEIGDITTGTGMKYDNEGLKIVASVRITTPLDTSAIVVPDPHGIGVTLL